MNKIGTWLSRRHYEPQGKEILWRYLNHTGQRGISLAYRTRDGFYVDCGGAAGRSLADMTHFMEIPENQDAPAAFRVSKGEYICSVKEGSQIALWSPQGIPEALVIAHSDDPPRLVYFDGTEEELKVSEDGSIVLPSVVGHSADFSMSVGAYEPRELPNEFDVVVEWSEPK